jgi:hypothetical protein
MIRRHDYWVYTRLSKLLTCYIITSHTFTFHYLRSKFSSLPWKTFISLLANLEYQNSFYVLLLILRIKHLWRWFPKPLNEMVVDVNNLLENDFDLMKAISCHGWERYFELRNEPCYHYLGKDTLNCGMNLATTILWTLLPLSWYWVIKNHKITRKLIKNFLLNFRNYSF